MASQRWRAIASCQAAAAHVGTGIAGAIGYWLLIAAHRDASTAPALFNDRQLIRMIASASAVTADP
jgi:hypothetical protein